MPRKQKKYQRKKNEILKLNNMATKYNHNYHGSIDMSSDVYYKILHSSRTEKFTVVCMQWFDEYDYDEERFVRNKEDEIHVFETEDMAIEKLNEWYEPDQIDSEYCRKKFDNIRE